MNSKLILGTVQFGLNYGINNETGRPSENDVFEILDVALEGKIESLDTADAYGNALERIGLYHKHRTKKFKILNKFKENSGLYDHVMCSLDKLYIPQFEVYSYHSFADYLNFPFLKNELLLLKSKKLIQKIGISVYTNSELEKVIADEDIDSVQFPYNLLDNQNIRGESISYAKSNNKEVHIRSVFLQGVFFMKDELLPEILMPLRYYLQKIRTYCEKESINLQSLALSYALYNKNIDRVLIGVDSKEQLLNNLNSISDLKQAFDHINRYIKVNETEILNPINWK